MIISKNPYSGKELNRYTEMGSPEIDKVLNKAMDAYVSWRDVSFSKRSSLMLSVAQELRENIEQYAEMITSEMGKPISQSQAEVEKCAWVCEYYAENAQDQLEPEPIITDGDQSYIRFDPIGPVLAIMPWNYPFWQVFRFAVPALMAGNVCVLKHASNVMGCSLKLEQVFKRAGFPQGCFTSLILSSKNIDAVIQDKRIRAVTLTGSTAAGEAVAATAGKEIKKSVLELGGSNALVVFEDARLEAAVDTCIEARFQNAGQSCIAGKRLLLQNSIAKKFLESLKTKVAQLKSGDPMDEDTFIGVQAREDLAQDLQEQIKQSLDMGAELFFGGKQDGAYHEPTIITNVTKEMPVFNQETFGPCIAVMTFEDEKEALELINATEFGLGVSLFTEDKDKALELIPLIEDGAVFVNELVKSDPRLPFGGTKKSGYGRELSYLGIREFVNIKTVFFR